MKKTNLKKFFAGVMALALSLSLTACGGSEQPAPEPTPEGMTTYKVGICNYVDDASLNQIVDNIRGRLGEIGQ